MTRPSISTAKRLLSVLLVFVVAFGVFAVVQNLGWLSVFGIESETNDSQVIRAIERTQEVSLVSLAVQGITQEDRSTVIFGKKVPGTRDQVFLQYEFDAKLGIDNDNVKVTKTAENAYKVVVPKFTFIGYKDPTFKVVVTDGSLLSGLTPNIDTVEMVNKILNSKAKDTYLASNESLLRDQTKVFYDGLISSIDPAIKTSYEFD